MGCIIVMMPRQEDAIHLKDIIINSGIGDEVIVSKRGAETLEIAARREISLVVCTRKAVDMGYEELTSYLPARVMVLLLTKDAALMPFSSNVMKLMIPFKGEDLVSSIRLLLPEEDRTPGKAFSGRKVSYKGAFQQDRDKKKAPPGRSPEEQKLIEEAKAILMNRNDMTEPEAFRYIQKNSMDMSRTMIETAKMILCLNGR